MKTHNNIKYIHSEKDYADAIALIDTLWDAQEDTPEYNEFEILIELLDAYERKLQFLGSANPKKVGFGYVPVLKILSFNFWLQPLSIPTPLWYGFGAITLHKFLLSYH